MGPNTPGESLDNKKQEQNPPLHGESEEELLANIPEESEQHDEPGVVLPGRPGDFIARPLLSR